MSLTYTSLAKKPRLFRQLTTLSVQEFETLSRKLKPEWEKREYARKALRPKRIRKVGQGHPYFGDFATLLLLLIMYTRTSCANALLGILFGISEPTVYNISHKLLPLLQDRFLPQTPLRKARSRINTLDELLLAYPELSIVIIDGCEIATRRPKRRQEKNYSGKSKRHGKKTVLLVHHDDGIILDKAKFRPGSVHDKRLLGEDALHPRLNKQSLLLKYTDSAWQGEDPLQGWRVVKRARRNHPLTKKEKRANRALSKIRIKVEHAIRRVKVFRRIGDKTMFRMKGKLDQTFNVAMNLANFKQLLRHPLPAGA